MCSNHNTDRFAVEYFVVDESAIFEQQIGSQEQTEATMVKLQNCPGLLVKNPHRVTAVHRYKCGSATVNQANQHSVHTTSRLSYTI